MNDYQFHQLADSLLQLIENTVDRQDEHDIDCETQGSVMTVTFENGKKIILNLQEPLHQIWIATPSQGYHFTYKDEQWICNRTEQSLFHILEEAFLQQLQVPIAFRE